ncbi:MAG: septum formation initiator family protein [Candidatus Parcubacteria bacterium]|nr:septum formation initiator family protein [Candidatus Parcubacteria bacterium]
MREFQEKRKIRRFFYSKKIVILLLLITALLSFSTIKVYLKSKNAVSKNEEAKKELADLEKRKAELEKDVNWLNTASGLEEEMRKNFNVQKPGEKVLVIVDKNAENVKIESGNNLSDFFSKIWGWVKSRF